MTTPDKISFPGDGIITGQYLLEIERLVNFCTWYWEPGSKKIILSGSAQEVIGVMGGPKRLKELLSLVMPEDRGFVIAVIRNTAKVRHTSKLYFAAEIDSVIKHFFIGSNTHLNADGKAVYYGIIQNITENRELVASLKAQNKQLSEISWFQSHKGRSPLATILGLITLMESGGLTDEDNTEILAGLKEASHQLDKIIRSITSQAYLSEL